MKCLYVLSISLTLVIVSSYKTAHDDFNIDNVVNDVNSVKKYAKCFLDKDECSEIGAFFKQYIPEAVRTSCGDCTKSQKRMAHLYLEALMTHSPKEYEDFKMKYDPSGQHFNSYRIACANH